MARIVHFEIPSDEPKRSIKFYEEVFGWKFNDVGGAHQTYWLISTGDAKSPGIDGGLLKRVDPIQHVCNTIDVADLDKSIELVKTHGGKILQPKAPIQGVGWIAYFKDIDGNVFSIMQADPNAK